MSTAPALQMWLTVSARQAAVRIGRGKTARKAWQGALGGLLANGRDRLVAIRAGLAQFHQIDVALTISRLARAKKADRRSDPA